MRSDILETTINDTTYQVENPLIADGLKATVTVLNPAGAVVVSDRLNLDRAKARSTFAEAAGIDPADLLTARSTVADWLAPPPETGTDPLPEPPAEAQEAALEHLHTPDILERRAAVVTAMGYAGDTTLVQLVDLVLNSRLLSRPLNLVVTGPSSAGKSFLVNLVVQLFPAHAVYHLSGMSERVLVFTDADLQHRVLIIGEASALHKEGIGASLLRAVAWEGKVAYETVEKTADGMRPRRIEKPGPTGFVTTTTGKVEAELETRVLTVHIPDTPETTRVILQATAERANGHAPEAPGLEPWHALAWWLETHGSRDVTIPYAERLAELVPSRLVRMRRDFTQILTLIQSHALLYQCQRERTEDGRIVADHRDYEAVFHLVSDVFGAIAADGVTPVLRETVARVVELTPNPDDTVTVARLAREMDLDRSAVQKRVTRAVAGGWLLNTETRRRRPAMLRGGDVLPVEQPALPLPEKLFDTPDVPRSHSPGFADGEAQNHVGHAEFPPMSHTPTQWDSGNTVGHTHVPHGLTHAEAENIDRGNVGTPGPTESFFESVETNVRQWLQDGTLTDNRWDVTRDDGRTMPAAKLETFVPIWLADLDNGGAPEREGRMWLEAVHRAVSASLSEAEVT